MPLKRHYRKRSALEIVDRIEFLQKEYGATFIQFLDEDFLISKARILEFLDLVEQRKLQFYYRAWMRADYFRDDYINVELAKRLNKNGLLIAVMGAESGSQNTLSHLKKGITPDQIIKASDTLKKTNIIPRFSFMVGLPGETKKDLKQTIKICKKLRKNPKADVPVINFRPYPGSPLYDEIKQNYFYEEPKTLHEWSTFDSAPGHGYLSIDNSPWIQEPEMVKKIVKV
jgi:anaerobic magnesium-protoporphyrin IX monomethyl ester cyclase